MKLLLNLFVCILLALTLGVGSALWAVNSPPDGKHDVANGPWRTNLALGSSQAGMYVRALVARTGLFALNRSETIYFIAETNPVDIVLGGPEMAVPLVENAEVVVAPTDKGVFLLRSLIEDDDRLDDLIKIQKSATCRPH